MHFSTYSPTYSLVLALLVGAGVSAGCVANGDNRGFTPGGIDVTIEGQWLVNDAPPTAVSCGDIATVRLLVCETNARDTCIGLDLEYPCAQGRFDTRPTPVLTAGRYFTRWETLDVAGQVIQFTDPQVLDVTSLAHVVLAAPSFDVQVDLPTSILAQIGFEQDFEANAFGTCTDVDIRSGQFEYSLHDGPTVESPEIVAETVQLCTEGSSIEFNETGTFFFDEGEYTLYITATEEDRGCFTDWEGVCTFTLELGSVNSVTCNALALPLVCN